MIVALAFHEQIAMEKLNQYFAAHEAAGESRAINCPKCSLGFALVLVNREFSRLYNGSAFPFGTSSALTPCDARTH
jgi:hypothetical protein